MHLAAAAPTARTPDQLDPDHQRPAPAALRYGVYMAASAALSASETDTAAAAAGAGLPTAPGMADAKRAADALVDAGVGRVLVFGSVARGDASKDSDIDLVAIYDDLGDYSDRWNRRCDLERRAWEAVGYSTDVTVTDAPEWAVRTTKVPCSFEARIVSDAVAIAETARHARIDWDKEIGLPDNPTAELQQRFTDLTKAVSELAKRLRPTLEEEDAADEGDLDELAFHENVRWARTMGEVHMVIECAAKATHIATVGTAAPRDHRISVLIAPQPPAVCDAFAAAAQEHGINLDNLHVWRAGSVYAADEPDSRFNEDSLRAHAAAAAGVAATAAEHCRRHDLDEAVLIRCDRHIARTRAALDNPLRLRLS